MEQRSKRNAERWATEVDKAHGRAASPFELSWWTETVLVALTLLFRQLALTFLVLSHAFGRAHYLPEVSRLLQRH